MAIPTSSSIRAASEQAPLKKQPVLVTRQHGRAPQCFGRAQRFYRGIEFTANKRFTNNFQFIASYVYSSLIGNYEGLFRNDNGQSDPNITSLFDLQSLLANTYGRLPNDRPHQFKFNGSYRTPWKMLLSGNFYAQSGVPFNQLIPHPIYGNNEGFGCHRAEPQSFRLCRPATGISKRCREHRFHPNAYYDEFGPRRLLSD